MGISVPQTPDTAPEESPSSLEPILEVLDNAVPPDLFRAACQVCQGKNWFYGHGSNAGDTSAFWKMDLDGNPVYDAIWKHVQPRCEALAGTPLRVIRQYANGHTYGLGGRVHLDDHRPGTYTFLFYPMPEWKDEWDGETVYFDQAGEITMAVKLRPNRAVLFDSRIPHVGRAPSRACPALRVTVAYKLEAAPGGAVAEVASPKTIPPTLSVVAPAEQVETGTAPITTEEVRSDGSTKVYRVTIPALLIDNLVSERLAAMATTVRLPGFRDNRIPEGIMWERYGAEARREAVNRLLGDVVNGDLARRNVLAKVEFHSGEESGDAILHVTCTDPALLPDPDFSKDAFEGLTATDELAQSVGVSAEAAKALLRGDLKAQLLDRLNATYPIPILPALVEPEFVRICKAAAGEVDAKQENALKENKDELRLIAERRVRLGFVVSELARRFQIQARDGAELEEKVLNHLLAHSPVKWREATEEELRDPVQE